MEKKELREGLRKRMEKHEFLSGGLYRSDIYHDPNQTGNTSGYITTVTENVLDFILEELDKAREEVYTDLIKEFDMLKEEDRVAKWFILAILKEELSKLTTK